VSEKYQQTIASTFKPLDSSIHNIPYEVCIFSNISSNAATPDSATIYRSIKMKHNVSHLLAAGALVAAASAKIQVEVRYSDNMIDVGNTDLFAQTWQKIYGSDGNQQSILTDVPTTAFNGGCNTWADEANLNVRTTINGQWGKVSGLGPHDSREGLVESLWAALKEVSAKNQWDVFNTCYGTTWQEGLPDWAYHGQSACGGANPTVAKSCPCDIGSAACKDHSLGHKVPSLIKANLYQDGTLLPDSIEIAFASAEVAAKGGCGTLPQVAGALAGFIPGGGDIFAAGIKIACLYV
jgi:hypothetical protein